MAMVETKEALENVEEIVSTPGLDAIYVGPGDLSMTLRGEGGIDIEDPDFVEALDTIVAACKKYNVVAGIHTNSTSYAKKMHAHGFRFLNVMSDTRLMSLMAQQVLTEMRDESDESGQSGIY
jgi:4-hydroxy-2-oxoheptanedioate aldolase